MELANVRKSKEIDKLSNQTWFQMNISFQSQNVESSNWDSFFHMIIWKLKLYLRETFQMVTLDIQVLISSQWMITSFISIPKNLSNFFSFFQIHLLPHNFAKMIVFSWLEKPALYDNFATHCIDKLWNIWHLMCHVEFWSLKYLQECLQKPSMIVKTYLKNVWV